MPMQVIAIFGLLEVGDTILDPFGKDPEDFAVLHFTECTIISSLEAIETEAVGRSDAERPTFYTVDELQAANRLVRNMVLRFRARKRREAAAASQDNARQSATPERSLTSHRRDKPPSPNRRRSPTPHLHGQQEGRLTPPPREASSHTHLAARRSPPLPHGRADRLPEGRSASRHTRNEGREGERRRVREHLLDTPTTSKSAPPVCRHPAAKSRADSFPLESSPRPLGAAPQQRCTL